ncbi:bifunctional phosphopantothenoylcysteine decarboxylase/phosphopantothenate--cysteine ligase CoaBC [Prevotella sp. A2931]|uniref:Coenzyme A biosynthesis bifunctional protein CoaBC n=1 Tax=Prevotella illustrans TaxID=2800387 RepID=A0ABS3M6W2_9BACT|nr:MULTISPECIES: bifunctional phosphopantothenoylcysteine decarboxylase/phosphopantothenate--cysteine ligase CoaBC [Prevotella]MBO1363861.1 bifunctional phosphopantothenoylcysteine decarboxylase/phosphopantothenate--cysteine ligase CoaBC [Prevotella illustrans]PTL26278.1 bifunctional phosphopantothenoylcysteine decarboxylase/phosphopantothenate--cysteine ligase CoaBC [Prevotella sp. oral taxon 820]
MLKGKNVVLGVSGGIAAYKAAGLASRLVKLGAEVDVVMTENACRFIAPLTFEALTSRKSLVDTFDRNFSYDVRHVSLARKADVLMVAPATANVIGKFANGICDDMLSTTFMACRCPKIVAPAMNTNMWNNDVLQDNLKKLTRYGTVIVQPAEGRLACGDVGIGKLASEDELLQHILLQIGMPHDMRGRRVLVTAGPTREPIDPVRYITNRSTGKMGFALAKMAKLRGADVTLVTGPVGLSPFHGVEMVPVTTAREMFDVMTSRSDDFDVVVMCAAVADYTPQSYMPQKMKKGDGELTVRLKRTRDILEYLGKNKREGQFVVGFSMETENLLDHSREKLIRKRADMICANTVASSVTGFAVDTNQVTLVMEDSTRELPLCSKDETANLILDAVMERLRR